MEQKFATWVQGEFKRQEADTLSKLTKKSVKGANPFTMLNDGRGRWPKGHINT